jgi:hypothetical protein
VDSGDDRLHSGAVRSPRTAGHKLAKLEEFSRRHPVDPLAFAVAYLGLDDTEHALAQVQKSYVEHSSGLNALKVDAIYLPLRNDLRFQDILKKLNLVSN